MKIETKIFAFFLLFFATKGEVGLLAHFSSFVGYAFSAFIATIIVGLVQELKEMGDKWIEKKDKEYREEALREK